MNSIDNYVEEDAKFVYILRRLHEYAQELKNVYEMSEDPKLFILKLQELDKNIKKQKCLRTVNDVESLPWVTEEPTYEEYELDNWTTLLRKMHSDFYDQNDIITNIKNDIHTHFQKTVYPLIMNDLSPQVNELVDKASTAESLLSSKISGTTFNFYDKDDENKFSDKLFEHIEELMKMQRFDKYKPTNKGNKKKIGWDKYSSYYTCLIDQPIPVATYDVKEKMFTVDPTTKEIYEHNDMFAEVKRHNVNVHDSLLLNEVIDIKKDGFDKIKAKKHGSNYVHATYKNKMLENEMNKIMGTIGKTSFQPIYYKEATNEREGVERCMLLVNISFEKIGPIGNMAFFLIVFDGEPRLISVDIKSCKPDKFNLDNIVRLVLANLHLKIHGRPFSPAHMASSNDSNSESDSESDSECDSDSDSDDTDSGSDQGRVNGMNKSIDNNWPRGKDGEDLIMHEDGRWTDKSWKIEYTWKNEILRDMNGNVVDIHETDQGRKGLNETDTRRKSITADEMTKFIDKNFPRGKDGEKLIINESGRLTDKNGKYEYFYLKDGTLTDTDGNVVDNRETETERKSLDETDPERKSVNTDKQFIDRWWPRGKDGEHLVADGWNWADKSGKIVLFWEHGVHHDIDGNVVYVNSLFRPKFEPETDSDSHDKSNGNGAMIKTKRYPVFDKLDELNDLIDGNAFSRHKKDTERKNAREYV